MHAEKGWAHKWEKYTEQTASITDEHDRAMARRRGRDTSPKNFARPSGRSVSRLEIESKFGNSHEMIVHSRAQLRHSEPAVFGANHGIGYTLSATLAARRPNTMMFAVTSRKSAVKLTAGAKAENEAAVTEIQKITRQLDVIANAARGPPPLLNNCRQCIQASENVLAHWPAHRCQSCSYVLSQR
ncbi:hypothetical protein DFH07DRAFT_766460 [Mycena maculata]|uniref:Uncharacterized protein n=1 Tax=Mycena maculata TaxID=230809 RepID=A0AAD7K424_9AGAR|nr:hypothetical protein DFH07DRAFT_766460 [Mycena maculata]